MALPALEQAQPWALGQVMGVDRVTDGLEAEKIPLLGAEQQEMLGALGRTAQAIAGVSLLDQTLS